MSPIQTFPSFLILSSNVVCVHSNNVVCVMRALCYYLLDNNTHLGLFPLTVTLTQNLMKNCNYVRPVVSDGTVHV